MSEPFIGQIVMFAGNFAPRGWAFCQGQLLPIAQNTALFSILGVTYGGNGQTTFALPDLRGRVPIQQGHGTGLPLYSLGEQGGAPTHTSLTTEMPAHNHVFTGQDRVSTDDATSKNPSGRFPAVAGTPVYADSANANGGAGSPTGSIGISGGSQPHNNMQPFLAVNFLIALVGIFPSRN